MSHTQESMDVDKNDAIDKSGRVRSSTNDDESVGGASKSGRKRSRANRKRVRRPATRAADRTDERTPRVAHANHAGYVQHAKCAVHAFLLKYQSALRKVPRGLPPKVRAGPPSKRIKRVSWCVESAREPAGASGGGGGGDPAVLAVGPARRALVYSRDQLMRLRRSPLVTRGLETAFAGNHTIAIVLKKRSDSPAEDDKGGKGDAPVENHKTTYARGERERRSADPRERVRRESETAGGGGVVLSPQRRSFTSGCGAPAPAPPPPVTPAPANNAPAVKADAGTRRIGSGRIMVRDGGTREEGGGERPERVERPTAEPYRPPHAHHRANNDRYDRRSFSRDSFTSDIKREREDRFVNEKLRDREDTRDRDNRRSGGRYSQRRLEKEDEPEWFSGGPTSQLETIELRGFDEPRRKKRDSESNGPKEAEQPKDGVTQNGGRRSPEERWRAKTSSPARTPDDSAADAPVSDGATKEADIPVVEKKTEEIPKNEQADFNLEEFLKFDTIPDVLTNGGNENESRFSQWFKRDSPAGDAAHYETLLTNMVDDLDKPSARSAHAQNVFAPISPPPPHSAHAQNYSSTHAPTHAAAQPQTHAPVQASPSLLELLRRANAGENPASEAAGHGKMQSLEELEARLRPQQPPPRDHDMAAFKRLLAQVSGGHAVTAAPEARAPSASAPPPPLTLMQMLNKSMEQQKCQQQQPHVPQELVYKLLQVQQRQQQQSTEAAAAGGPAGLALPDSELLQRPEAQALIRGVGTGEITAQHLAQQLANPAVQSRHRDVLAAVVRYCRLLHQRQPQMSPLPTPAGAAPQLMTAPHQQLRLSPLPHNSVPARIPSPRELAAHTQSIMQSALIKRKLEEQKENYRRRHDAITHPTPISFTPTSVLRKMTAEKEPELPPGAAAKWTQQAKLPPGRPIVKGNQSGAAPASNYGVDFSHQYMNQQMPGLNRPSYPVPQQRQMPNMGVPNMTRGIPSGTTIHQLLVHTHQRSLAELGGAAGAGVGGGDNQLARWFSPELLAQASAGKLPSAHLPNALSLEDLERHHHSPAPPVRN